MADPQRDVRPSLVPRLNHQQWRRVFTHPDGGSLRFVGMVIIGIPVAAAIARAGLVALGVDTDAALFGSHTAAVLVVGAGVFVLSRQFYLLTVDRDQLHRFLAETTEQYRRIAENASDVVYTADSQRNVTWISPSLSKVLGWEPEEAVGRSIASFLHPDDRASTEQVRERIYSGQAYETPPGGFVMRFSLKAGGYRWMAINLHSVVDTDGRFTGVVGGLTDVEDLVHARQRAEDSERMGRITADAMLDPQVLLEAIRDDGGEIVDFTFVKVNRATAEYFSLDQDAIEGRRLLEMSPTLLGSDLFSMFVQALESDTPLTVDGFSQSIGSATGTSYFDFRARRAFDDQLALTWRNVTDVRTAALRISESEMHFRLLAENSLDVVILSDASTMLNWVSPSSTLTLGWTPAELQGHLAVEFIHPDEVADVSDAVPGSAEHGEQDRLRFRWRRPDGSYRWMEAAVGPMADDGDGRSGRVVSLRDVDAEVAAQLHLTRRATYDSLTGALMREAAFDRMTDIAGRAAVTGVETGVLFLDLDDFKAVNDGQGHAAGDTVLRVMVERARAAVRGVDAVARMGGDEFLVILEGVGSLEHALQVAHKVHASAGLPITTASGDVTVSLSIGVTIVVRDEPVDDTVARADQALYEAKRAGRNRVIAIAGG